MRWHTGSNLPLPSLNSEQITFSFLGTIIPSSVSLELAVYPVKCKIIPRVLSTGWLYSICIAYSDVVLRSVLSHQTTCWWDLGKMEVGQMEVGQSKSLNRDQKCQLDIIWLSCWGSPVSPLQDCCERAPGKYMAFLELLLSMLKTMIILDGWLSLDLQVCSASSALNQAAGGWKLQGKRGIWKHCPHCCSRPGDNANYCGTEPCTSVFQHSLLATC